MMDISEVLQFVDEVVYAKEGKRLNDLQRGIIQGTLKRQKYSDIAKTYNCTTGYAKEVGYELWRMLSEIFGETVDKKHLQSVLERQGNLNISFGEKSVNSSVNSNVIGCINFGYEQPTATPDENQFSTPESQNIKNKSKNAAISKLRNFGLNDEQIAEALGLPLEVVKQVDLEE